MSIKHLLVILTVLAAGACAGPSFTEAPTIAQNPNPSVPQAAVVTFTANGPVETTLTISTGEREWKLSYDSSKNSANGLPVIGLYPGVEHEVVVTIRDEGGGETTSAPLKFTAPPVPEGKGEFPPIEVTVNKSGQLEPGYVLFNPRRSMPGRTNLKFGSSFGMLLIVDYEGTPLWYYRNDSRVSDFEILDNGNIVYVTQDFRVIEIDWLGNIVNQWYAANRPQGPQEGAIRVEGTDTFHHEIDELPNGNLVALGSEWREVDNYYTDEYDENAPRKKQKVVGDVIVEFERDTGKVVWSWKAFDYLDPFRIGYETFQGYWGRRGFPGMIDWSHANNLLYDESDDSFIVNFRYQAAAVKIDRATKEIKWIFGEPTGWGKLSDKVFKMEGDGRWPFHQHSPTPTPNGTLLVFDNGNFQRRPFDKPLPPNETYTRAVEYSLDEENMVVRELWNSEKPGPDSVVSYAMGDIEWLPQTENVLVAYGLVLDREAIRNGSFQWKGAINVHAWTRLRQFTRSDPPEVVWEIVLDDREGEAPVNWVLFGAEHIPSWRVMQTGK
jgi:arylsulfate sulfotransferase